MSYEKIVDKEGDVNMSKAKQRVALVKALQFEGMENAESRTSDWSLEQMTEHLNELYSKRLFKEFEDRLIKRALGIAE